MNDGEETVGRPEQEGFGQASLGEAQSSDPPPDPEYLEDGEDRRHAAERGVEEIDDEDAGPAYGEEQAKLDEERDQAEG